MKNNPNQPTASSNAACTCQGCSCDCTPVCNCATSCNCGMTACRCTAPQAPADTSKS